MNTSHLYILKLMLVVVLFTIASACTSKKDSCSSILIAHEFSTSKQAFTRGVVSRPDRFEQGITFLDGGLACVVGLTDSVWNYKSLLYFTCESGEWQIKDTLTFGFGFIGEPMYSTQFQKLFFIAYEHEEGKPFQTDIYSVPYAEGTFGEAEKLDSAVNSTYSEWHPSIAENGNLYFSSERRGEGKIMSDIYMSAYVDGRYKKAVRLDSPVNTDNNDSDPLIAPDESYLIVQSDRAGNFGKHDFFVSFKNVDGWWDTPVNLGTEVNSEAWEIGPSFSPSQDYILFTRRKEWKTDSPSNIYMFDTELLEKYRMTSY